MLYLYLSAIVLAEATTALYHPLPGAIIHILVAVALLAHASLQPPSPDGRLYLALSLIPLVRITSLSIPALPVPIIYWYGVTAVPVLLATLVLVRNLGLAWSDIGMVRRTSLEEGKGAGRYIGRRGGQAIAYQMLIGLVGIPIGLQAYLVIPSPAELANPTLGGLWVPALGLAIAGLTDELIFRGVLQKVAVDQLGQWGIIMVSGLFAVLFIGSHSWELVGLAFGMGLLFSWLARQTGSIVGVATAHGLLNLTAFIVAPLWLVSYLPPPGQANPTAALMAVETAIPLASAPAMSPLASGDSHTATPRPAASPRAGEATPTPLPSTATPTASSQPSATPTRTASPTIAAPTPTEEVIPEATPQATPTAIPRREIGFGSHIVARGETLSTIGRGYGITAEVLSALNGIASSNIIWAGQHLWVPDEPLTFHTVASGETLEAIASRYLTTVPWLKTANRLPDESDPAAGRRLLVPASAAVPR